MASIGSATSVSIDARAATRAAPSITPAALGARIILCVAFAFWGAMLWVQSRVDVPPWWVKLLLHGAEGAMVGAICDWMAVNGVYKRARTSFEPLVNQVSAVVVKDMIRLRELVGNPGGSVRERLDDPATIRWLTEWLKRQVQTKEQLRSVLSCLWQTRMRESLISRLSRLDLRAVVLGGGRGATPGLLAQPPVRAVVEHCLRASLDSPERARRLRELLCEMGRHVTVTQLASLGSRDEARRVLRELYDEHAREHTVRWLATVDLRGALHAQGKSEGLLREDSIRAVVAHCVRHAAKDMERTKALHDSLIAVLGNKSMPFMGFSVKLRTLVDWFMSPSKLHEHVTSIAALIEQPPSAETGRLQQLGQEYALAYLDGWYSLSESDRRRAAETIHDLIVPQVLDSVADASFETLQGLTVEKVLRAVVTEELMLRRMQEAADWFARPSGSANGQWGEAARAYVGAWLKAWHGLPEEVRRRAAADLVDLAGEWTLEAATEWAWIQREEILRAGWHGRLSELPWARALVEVVQYLAPAAANLDERAANALAEQLRGMGADAFVGMLEARTRPKLDMIQLNGAILGLVLGCGAGLAASVPQLMQR